MTRYLPCLALAVSVVAASPASAQPGGSLATWVEACELPADLEGLLASNAMIVHKDAVLQNPDGSYRLLHEPFTKVVDGLGALKDLCTNSIFYGQERVAIPGGHVETRSAVLVGPDLVLTTWHNPFAPGAVGNYRVVTGLRHRQIGDTCVPTGFDQVPASQVFSVTAVVADGYSMQPFLDMLLLRLDRVVADTAYPRVRRSGRGWPRDGMTLIGHPERMDAKVDTAGIAGGYTIRSDGREALLVANVHALDRSSGSMVYNRTQRILETANTSGYGTDLLPHTPPTPPCHTIVHVNGYHERHASLRYFAQHIPAFELIVDSLDAFVHVLPVGAPPQDTANQRTVKAPLTAAAPIAYQIVPPAPAAPGQPSLSILPGGPLNGTLAPGAGFTVAETVDTAGVACGYYERQYEIRDQTHGFVDRARHLFEVGIREFKVGDPPRPTIMDLAAPFEDVIEYPVTNPRPTPVVVRVMASDSWVTLNGVTSTPDGPTVSIDLPLDGHASTVLRVGVAPWAVSFPLPHTYPASLSFQIPAGDPCPTIGGTVVRQFTFTYGIEMFDGPAEMTIPPLSTGTLPVHAFVNEEFCVGDLNLRLITSGVPARGILAQLGSPVGTPVLVWDRHDLPFPYPGGDPLADVLDDEGPLHPDEPFATFDNQRGRGTWTLRIGNALPQQAVLDQWTLILEARPCAP